MSGPRPPGRWLALPPIAWLVSRLRRRPHLYRAVYDLWATLRSAPYVFSRRDPSQFGEGRLLVATLPDEGLYLDVGCHEPVRFNNTWLLRRRGWRGWNVDASASHAAVWRMVRPRDRFLHTAVVAERGVDRIQLFEFQPEYSGLSTVSTDRVDSILARGDEHRATTSMVPAVHIADLLRQFADAWGRYPDLLLTDVEGLDAALIAAADPTGLRHAGVRYLLVEDLSSLETEPGGPDLASLAAAGWREVGRRGLSVLLTVDPTA